MTINIPCWTTSKEEADKLVDNLSEVCFEYGKDESSPKMLNVFYATKALKNYVGIMQGRIELLNARIAELEHDLSNKEIEYTDLWDDMLEMHSRIAELEADNKKTFDLVRKLRMYCIWANWDNPDTEDEFNEFDVEVCKWLSKFMEREE